MKKRSSCVILVAAIIFGLVSPAHADSFVAYSLRVAEKRLSESAPGDSEVSTMAGITRPFGVVYDEQSKDLIIVGQAYKGEHEVLLDDFVVALRAIHSYGKWPLVSIDKTAETKTSGKQTVRFEGGIENTPLGEALLAADVVLKKLGLGELEAEIWGILSYFDLYKKYFLETGDENDVQSRFWFKTGKPVFVSRDGIAVVKELEILVETEVLAGTADLDVFHDEPGEMFAKSLTDNYFEVSDYYPEIERLNALFRLVGLAAAIERFSQQSSSYSPDLVYWLVDYDIPWVDTPKDYPLLRREEAVSKGEKLSRMSINGGIELRAQLLDLKDGSVTALRDIVLKSRPDQDSLKWNVPLSGWHVPGYPEHGLNAQFPARKEDAGFVEKQQVQCSFTRKVSPAEVAVNYEPHKLHYGSRSLNTSLPELTFHDALPKRFYQTGAGIGGVMLDAVAKPEGVEQVELDLANGHFSLILDGESVQLDPKAFCKFVTTLWSVYYGQDSIGISIDPIAPNIDKHLVRYIGNVINSDLGRVMREADYTMKKWVVGTEAPDIAGFRDVDELMAVTGIGYFGASRRFWFLPKDMRFTKGDGILLFNSGRMTLKTEYVFQNKSLKAEPGDERFAEFFTSHYEEIAEKHPVYQELSEYAKLVSLAQYLKISGVPLFWFLMANKDLVITEDSPGTVDELAKGSKHFHGAEIRGGVNLSFDNGQYVYDSEALAAIHQAISRFPQSEATSRELSSNGCPREPTSEPFSFDLKEQSYTVIPQHSLTSGQDRRGIRYQTDIALRRSGTPDLELVRYYNPGRASSGEFGKGWHLLIPYRIRPTDDQTVEFQNAILSKRMALENLLTGTQETLTFSEDRYSIVGYVPDSLETSQVVGLFVMTDASFRLADKIGNEFHFDQAGFLTDMLLGDFHHVHYEYYDGFIRDFDVAPYVLETVDSDRVEFLNVTIPKRLEVKNLANGGVDVLTFHPNQGIDAYVPESGNQGVFKKMVLMTDGSFRLLDCYGNEIAFDPAGRFEGIAPNEDHFRTIRSLSQDKQTIQFKYALGEDNCVRISKAFLFGSTGESNPSYVVDYNYDREGRLAKVESGKVQHDLN